MLFKTLNANWRLASFSNRVLLASNLLLTLTVLVLGAAAINNRDRLTVLPPSIDKPFMIGWSSATKEYHESMAIYFSGLIGMIGPSNIDYVIKTLERFTDASVAAGIKTKLRAISADYQFQQSTSSNWFEPQKTAWEQSTGKVFVIGRLMSVSGTKHVSAKNAVYEYRIDIREGQPVISHFDSYEGAMPHTQEWLRDPRKAEADEKRRQQDDEETRRVVTAMEIRESNEASASSGAALE